MALSQTREAATMSSNVEAVKKYQATRAAIMLRPTKEEGEKIKQAAAAAGQSVQQYMLDAVRARMESEGRK